MKRISCRIGWAAVAAGMMMGAAYGGGRDWVPHAGEYYAINAPDVENGAELSANKAREIVGRYRFIYVNASLKTISEAVEEGVKISNALNRRPAVAVYLPRHIGDGQRNDYHPNFQAALADLIQHGLLGDDTLLIVARSYGVHQTLRVVVDRFNNPRILLLGVAPAFGAFGGQNSENVNRFIDDIEETQARFAMIASEQDGFTWRSGGAAYRRRRPGVGFRGDNHVGRAIHRNRDNVKTFVIRGADHTPVDEYLRHGLIDAMRRAAAHFDMHRTAVGDVLAGRPVLEPSTVPVPRGDGDAPPPPPSLANNAESDTQESRQTGRLQLPAGLARRESPVKPQPGRASSPADTAAQPEDNDGAEFRLTLPAAHIVRSARTRPVQVDAAGVVLAEPDDWQLQQVSPGVYHLRLKTWRGFFWLVDTGERQVYQVSGDGFGRPSEGTRKLLRNVEVEIR